MKSLKHQIEQAPYIYGTGVSSRLFFLIKVFFNFSASKASIVRAVKDSFGKPQRGLKTSSHA